ncbi:N-substituted formamide deformylase [subsurface metagenome]
MRLQVARDYIVLTKEKLCVCIDHKINEKGKEMVQNSLLITNANIITCDPANPRVEALFIFGDRIAEVGETKHIQELAGSRTQIIDAHGKTVTPGFIDVHMHPRGIFPDMKHRMHWVNLFDVSTMEGLIASLKAKADVTPHEQWIQGRGYQDSKIGKHPTRRDLDEVSTQHLITITHSSGHVSVVNSAVLEKADVGKNTPNPNGGAYDRYSDGTPNGVCRESAAKGVREATGVSLPVATTEEEKEGIALCLSNFVSKGITSINDTPADAGISPDRLNLYQLMLKEGCLPLRVTMMIYYEPQIIEALERVRLKTGFGSNMLKIGPLKLFAGNSLSGRTCWLYEPYLGSHKDDKPPYYGIPHPLVSSGQLKNIILEGHKAGFQWAVHSNGDRDIDALLDAYASALEQFPREDHRHRIEHCSIVGRDARILERIKHLGVIPVFHEYTYEHGDKYTDYGEERIAMMHAYRSALDLGIQPAGHSDWPVSAADPMLRIQSMVTRKSSQGVVYGPQQKVTPEEAIYVWTMGNARAIFEERERGSIQVGKLADLVFLSNDPTRVPADSIKDIKVEKTILGGKIAYEMD